MLPFFRRVARVGSLGFATAAVGFAVHCGSSDSSEFPGGGDPDSGGPGSSSGFTCNGPCPVVDGSPGGGGPVCGDGRITDKEGCDDGNTKSGDGCDATCAVEPGWNCPTAGLRCVAAKCGDGILAGAEECEYPPGQPVTGCDPTTCRVDVGFDCDPVAKTCKQTVCGNQIVERGETCDDGNDLPFDGCYKCKKEPSCTNGVCQSACGDGQRFGAEACDDGNTRDGDGCSSTCKVETGYACTDVVGDPPTSVRLPVLMRDFVGVDRNAGGASPHPDFNRLGGSGIQGMVKTALDATGRMVLADCDAPTFGDNDNCTQNKGWTQSGASTGASDTAYNGRHNISTKGNFRQWYANVPAVNIVMPTEIELPRQGNGTYFWDSQTSQGAKDYFDVFGATGGWIAQGKETAAACNPDRNVSFTSETHFWFEYQGGESFAFSGDDDTWVFVNRTLAIDLGGLHGRLDGSFTLDANNGTAAVTTGLGNGTANLGLTKGGVYELVMFQAERNQCGSNFGVTLKDFNRPKSTCKSTCGDGVVASDEVCDDGKNDGTYGGCMPGCLARAPYCGDGTLQAGEDCDDANTNNDDGCTTTCHFSMVH